MREGRVPQVGEMFTNPDLADTYQAIAEGGRDAFYRGELAQRMADALASEPARVSGAALTLGASIGAVLLPKGWSGTMAQALEHADAAMYHCKRGEGNAVVILEPGDARAA